jgi:hypothetical protein
MTGGWDKEFTRPMLDATREHRALFVEILCKRAEYDAALQAHLHEAVHSAAMITNPTE